MANPKEPTITRAPGERLGAVMAASASAQDPLRQLLDDLARDGRPSMGWVLRMMRAGADPARGGALARAWADGRDTAARRALLRRAGRDADAAAQCAGAPPFGAEPPHAPDCAACGDALVARVGARLPTLDGVVAGRGGPEARAALAADAADAAAAEKAAADPTGSRAGAP